MIRKSLFVVFLAWVMTPGLQTAARAEGLASLSGGENQSGQLESGEPVDNAPSDKAVLKNFSDKPIDIHKIEVNPVTGRRTVKAIIPLQPGASVEVSRTDTFDLDAYKPNTNVKSPGIRGREYIADGGGTISEGTPVIGYGNLQ